MSTTSPGDIAEFLDLELDIISFRDDSQNGLQVENSGRACRVCLGVDASLAFFTEAARRDAGLLVCHHGLSWGDSLKRITGMNYHRLKFLMDHDMALYACHLPLDAHPELGNNAGICRALDLEALQPFGFYHGTALGFCGTLPRPESYDGLKERLRALFNNTLSTMDFGRETVRSVAVVSGGGSSVMDEAGRSGVDVFLSGEPQLSAFHVAQEYGLNAVFAGHYATETFGVRALAGLLREKFGVPAEFIDMGIKF